MSAGDAAGAETPDGTPNAGAPSDGNPSDAGGFGAGAPGSKQSPPTPPSPPTAPSPDAAATSAASSAEASVDGVSAPPPGGAGSISVEDLVVDLERVSTERDEYLDSLRRLQAEFENYRKAVAKRESDARARANNALVAELLPVLDACDGAVANGADDVAPVRTALIDALVKQGLERIEPTDAPFDPEQHEAVMHEAGDGDGGPIVAEVLRVGYGWKGNVVRPAMVRVVG